MAWIVNFLGADFLGLGMVWADVIGFITGVACLYLLGRGIVWNFAFGIVSMLCYAFVTWHNDLWANFALAWIFVALNIYGWITWRSSAEENYNAGITATPRRWIVPLAASGIVIAVAVFFALRSSSSAPGLDSVTMALSLVAQFMIAFKYVENWVLWLVADVFYIALFFSQQMWSWMVLYVIYTVLSAKGLRDWRAAARTNLAAAGAGG